MRRPLSDSEVIGASVGALAAICTAGLLGSMRGEMSRANDGLLLVLVIIGAAAIGGRWAGAVTALVSAMAFDFFLTKPYGSLAIKSGGDIVTTILLLVVGLTVGQFANSRWRDRETSRAGTEEVAGLYRVASLTAEGADADDVIERVEQEVAEVLHLATCRYEPGTEATSLAASVPELEPSGRIDAPYVHLGDGFALPEAGFTIVVRSEGAVAGRLVCVPATPPVGASRDRRRTALVLAEHLGLALERAASAPG